MARRFQRSRRALGNGALSQGEKDQIAVPDGAVLAGRQLIEEGHSREDVEAFLAVSFRHIDVGATLERLYVGSGVES